MTWFKKKDFVPPPWRAPYPKKGEGSQSFKQPHKGRGSFVYGGSSGGARRADTEDILRVRIGKKLVVWEDPRNKGKPPTRCV